MILNIVFWALLVLTAICVFIDLVTGNFAGAVFSALLFYPAWLGYSFCFQLIENFSKSNWMWGFFIFLVIVVHWIVIGGAYTMACVPKPLQKPYIIFNLILLAILSTAW